MVKRRKSRVAPPPPDCPLGECMDVLAGAWTPHVIWYLREGERCFTELHLDLAGISAKILTSRLRKLEKDGVLQRTAQPTSPPTVWYSLTPLGKELGDVVRAVVGIHQKQRSQI